MDISEYFKRKSKEDSLEYQENENDNGDDDGDGDENDIDNINYDTSSDEKFRSLRPKYKEHLLD